MWTIVVRDPTGKLHSKTQLKVGVVRIGRGADCDIVLQSNAVSRLHGRLLVGNNKGLVFSDEKSSNGSLVNGLRVNGAVDVNEHSMINLGGFLITLERDRSADAGDEANKTLQFNGEQMRNLMPLPPSRPSPPAVQAATTIIPAARAVPPAAAPVAAASAAVVPPPAAPQAPPTLQSPIAGMQFKIPEVPAATRQVEQVQHDSLSASMGHLLEQQISGIQSRRTEVAMNAQQAKQRFEQAWRETVIAARQLQGKVQTNPKVKYYVISRDESEVNVKIIENSKRGYSNLTLSLKHPENDIKQEGRCWFGVLGEDPRSFTEPKEALEEFVRRIASRLA